MKPNIFMGYAITPSSCNAIAHFALMVELRGRTDKSALRYRGFCWEGDRVGGGLGAITGGGERGDRG